MLELRKFRNVTKSLSSVTKENYSPLQSIYNKHVLTVKNLPFEIRNYIDESSIYNFFYNYLMRNNSVM